MHIIIYAGYLGDYNTESGCGYDSLININTYQVMPPDQGQQLGIPRPHAYSALHGRERGQRESLNLLCFKWNGRTMHCCRIRPEFGEPGRSDAGG